MGAHSLKYIISAKKTQWSYSGYCRDSTFDNVLVFKSMGHWSIGHWKFCFHSSGCLTSFVHYRSSPLHHPGLRESGPCALVQTQQPGRIQIQKSISNSDVVTNSSSPILAISILYHLLYKGRSSKFRVPRKSITASIIIIAIVIIAISRTLWSCLVAKP